MAPSLHDYAARVDYPIKRKLLSLLDGRHQGLGAGSSQEFLDMAEYRLGDDASGIDWKSTARMAQPIVKRFESTSVLNVVLVVDGGSNMGALAPGSPESGPLPKSEVVRELVTALSWVISAHGDHLGLIMEQEGNIRRLPARAGRGHAETLVRIASDQKPLGDSSDFSETLRAAVASTRRRSLVFVITDQGRIDNALAEQLRRLSIRNEVVLFVVEDVDPTSFSGVEDLRDVSGERLPSFVEQNEELERQWQQRQKYLLDSTAGLASNLGLAYSRLAAKEDVLPALLHVFQEVRRGSRTA